MTPHGGRRPGAGRPRRLEGARSLTVVLEAPLYDALRARAEARGVSLSEEVRAALAAHLEPGL